VAIGALLLTSANIGGIAKVEGTLETGTLYDSKRI